MCVCMLGWMVWFVSWFTTHEMRPVLLFNGGHVEATWTRSLDSRISLSTCLLCGPSASIYSTDESRRLYNNMAR